MSGFMAEALVSADRSAAPAQGLLTRLVHNSTWMLGGGVATRLLSLARGIVLARLLAPNDFGLFGLASIVTGFAVTFGDVGLGTLLIYLSEADEEHANTAFWANLAVATGAAGAVIALAPWLSRFFGTRQLLPILIVSAFTLWCQIASTVPTNLLRRQLRFRPIAIVNAVSSVVWFGSAAGLALWHSGVWALVVSMLIATLVNVLWLHIAAGCFPRWEFSRQSLKVIAPFSGWYLGQAVGWYLVFNIDNILIGKYLGTAALGLYALAYNYASFPVTLVANAIGNAGIPELAKLRFDTTRFWNSFRQASRLLIGGVSPISCALLVAAPDLFPVVLGAKWNGAIRPFQLLMVYMIIRCLYCDPFMSLGRYDWMLWLAIVNLAVVTPGIYLLMRRGIVGVALAVMILESGIHLAALYVVPILRDQFVKCLETAAPPVLAAAGPALLAGLLRRLQPGLWGLGDQRVFWMCFEVLFVFGSYFILQRRYVREVAESLRATFSRGTLAQMASSDA